MLIINDMISNIVVNNEEKNKEITNKKICVNERENMYSATKLEFRMFACEM